MSAPYSYDLREKAVNAIERGEKKTYGYSERNKEDRKKFLETISSYAKERFVYVD